MTKYGGKSVADLFNVTRTTMPTANPASLDPLTYASLVAFILQENAIVPGEVALPSDPRQIDGDDGAGRWLRLHGLFAVLRAEDPRPPELPRSLHARELPRTLPNPPPQDWLTWRRGWSTRTASAR